MHLDETSCGPLCQHPQCWASNRRVERGLPRLDVFPEKQSQFENETGLPTLKIQNMLDDYGLSSTDHYPSKHHVAISSLGTNRSNRQRRRSASAPSITTGNSVYPQTPYQSAESGTRGETSRRERSRSRSALLEPIKASYPPKLSKVYLNQLCGPVNPSSEVFMESQVYVWQPSNKALQKRKDITVKESQSTEPRIISPKDMTEALLPSGIEGQRQCTKKMKNKRNRNTPTGGRPYTTHPSKSPPAITRRTLPADMDEGIAQLLSLPRDVMLEILERTKESDLFDKDKVQALLAKVMPHVHFDSDPSRTASDQGIGSSPPLHAMGFLRNQKMPILEGKHKFERADIQLQHKVARMPRFLDHAAGVSGSHFSYQGRGDEGCDYQQRVYDEDGHSLMMPAPTTVSEGLSRRKNHLGAMSDVGHLLPGKITSVSAKSLPPLIPGVRATKPFNYNTQSLDLALSPLSTPENPTPEEPSTPRSGKVSTLYVTLPSDPSEDGRNITPVTTAKHPHLAVLRQESPYTRSITSSHASEEFERLRQAMSPSYSSHVSKAPNGTPAATAPQAIFRENTLLSAKTSTSYDSKGLEDLVEKTNGKSSGSSRVRISSAEQGLHTIHEQVTMGNALSTPDTVVAHPGSVTSSIKPPRSVSPWDQLPNGKTPPPVVRNSATPTPSNPSPDAWPVVDERSYLHSPEAVESVVHSKKKDIPETVAPPPSPEPRGDVESSVASLDDEELKCTGVSLTPFAENDDKVCKEGMMIQHVMEVNQLEEQSPTPEEPGVTSNSRDMKSPDATQKQAATVLPAIQEDENDANHFTDAEEEDKTELASSNFKNIDNDALNIDKLEINEK